MPIKEKPLKRISQKNVQIDSYTDAIKRGQKTYHVIPSSDGWKVKRIGSSDERTFISESDAKIHARKLAQDSKTEIIIHGRDGLIKDRDSYANDQIPPQSK